MTRIFTYATLCAVAAVTACSLTSVSAQAVEEDPILTVVGDGTYTHDGVIYKQKAFPYRQLIVVGLTNAARSATTNLEIPDRLTVESGTPFPVTEIGVDAFKGDTNLKSFTFPKYVTDVDSSAFEGTSLTSVTIPSTVTTIEADAFKDTPLKTVTIYAPEDDTTQTLKMEDGAFDVSPASGFTDCYITYRDAPSISENVFSGAHYATLHYLPDLTDDQETAYREGTGWKEFFRTTPTGVSDISVDSVDAQPEYYTLNGTPVMADDITPGLYIVRQGKKVTKTVIR